MGKTTDSSLHTTRGSRLHRPQTLTREIRGIKFVKRANMFCVYYNPIQEGKAYMRQWFSTLAEAEKRLYA